MGIGNSLKDMDLTADVAEGLGDRGKISQVRKLTLSRPNYICCSLLAVSCKLADLLGYLMYFFLEYMNCL
jgi:hypothetical protein